jgi:hypothetical protein
MARLTKGESQHLANGLIVVDYENVGRAAGHFATVAPDTAKPLQRACNTAGVRRA